MGATVGVAEGVALTEGATDCETLGVGVGRGALLPGVNPCVVSAPTDKINATTKPMDTSFLAMSKSLPNKFSFEALFEN